MKIATVLIGIFLAFNPIVVSADTSTEAILLQINTLRKQIEEMQARLDLLKNPDTNVGMTPVAIKKENIQLKRSLRVGSEGSDVTYLQNFLAKDKAIYPEGLVTGYYGGMTRSAVKRYQEKHGLEAVGSVGPLTRAKVNGTVADDGDGAKVVEKRGSEAIYVYEKGGTVYWKANKVKAKKGVVLVWSKDENPEYPARENDMWSYFESSLNGSHKPNPRAGSGLYYVRMCAFDFYTNECDIYSNQIKIEL